MKDVYEAYARLDGKAAGFVGRYRTKEEAQQAKSQLPVRVKRVRLTDEEYQQWADSGHKPRGWIG
jgi:ribosomal protein S16